jgi:hypothetical protein
MPVSMAQLQAHRHDTRAASPCNPLALTIWQCGFRRAGPPFSPHTHGVLRTARLKTDAELPSTLCGGTGYDLNASCTVDQTRVPRYGLQVKPRPL